MGVHVPFFNALPGYKFLPTHQELLGYYLRNKIYGNPFKCDSRVMKEADIYKQEPWDLWYKFGGHKLNQDEDLFFFTQVSKVSNDGTKNMCRKAGSGTWKGDTSPKTVYDSERKILGSYKRFHFEPKQMQSWVMVEYILDKSLIPESCRGRDLALCRIWNITKDRKRKATSDHEDGMMDDTTTPASISPSNKVPRKDTPQSSYVESSAREEQIPHGDKNDLRAFCSEWLVHHMKQPCSQPNMRSVEQQPFHEQQQQLVGDDMLVSNDHHEKFQGVESYDQSIVQPSPNALIPSTDQPVGNLDVPDDDIGTIEQFLKNDLEMAGLEAYQYETHEESVVTFQLPPKVPYKSASNEEGQGFIHDHANNVVQRADTTDAHYNVFSFGTQDDTVVTKFSTLDNNVTKPEQNIADVEDGRQYDDGSSLDYLLLDDSMLYL